MELFWKIVPFVTPVLVMMALYYRYRNQGKEEKPSWLEQRKIYQYLKLVFITRIRYRQWTIFFVLPLFFSLFLGVGSLIANIETTFIYPPIPLEKMQTKQGIIKSIVERKKMDSLLVLAIDNGATEKYAFNHHKSINEYIDKNVTIFYTKSFSSVITVEDKIFQINANDTDEIIERYDRKGFLRRNEWLLDLTKYCLYIGGFSAFIIWLANHKELPIHRLNRIKIYRKLNKGA